MGSVTMEACRTRGKEKPKMPDVLLICIGNDCLGVYFSSLSIALKSKSGSDRDIVIKNIDKNGSIIDNINRVVMSEKPRMTYNLRICVLFERNEMTDGFPGLYDTLGESGFTPVWFDRFVENWYLLHLDHQRNTVSREAAIDLLKNKLHGGYFPDDPNLYISLGGDACLQKATAECRTYQKPYKEPTEFTSTNAHVLVGELKEFYNV